MVVVMVLIPVHQALVKNTRVAVPVVEVIVIYINPKTQNPPCFTIIDFGFIGAARPIILRTLDNSCVFSLYGEKYRSLNI